MNRIKFNRPTATIAHTIDNILSKGLGDLAHEFSSTRPASNVIESDSAYSLKIAAPGLSKEAFDIQINKDQLIVKVSQEKGKEGDSPKYTRREFNYNAFTRTFHLSDKIDTTKIDAGYENGILTINLEKKEIAKDKAPRTIAIS